MSLRCLIVDDSPTLRRILTRMLGALGLETEEAEHGRAALEACRRRMPEVILLDWNMPEMDGLTFLKALRREPEGNRPVVIFCTTMDDIAHIEQALEAGADEYVIKPFDQELIRLKLQQTGVL